MMRRAVLSSIVFGSLGLMAAPLAAQGSLQAFGGDNARGSTRIAYFDTPAENQFIAKGQFVIQYGQPEWQPDYEAQFDELTKGKRWRFGNNFWTTLDTSLALNIAGAEVPPGYYYLVLERSNEDQWYLVLLDPTKLRAKHMDASSADETTGGIKAPLDREHPIEPVTTLAVSFIKNDADLTKATLDIRWGKHKLSAPIDVDIDVPASD